MCGLAGFFSPSSCLGKQELCAIAAQMAGCLRHRGPDDSGAWADAESGIALGFQRLSIVDLSPGGRQPMVSPGGRYVIAFNGEIYNHRALRAELERASGFPGFRGRSDTEVLLAAVDQWGLEQALQRFVGMFAFALWDQQGRTLHLVRDRLGERPLYYGWIGKTLLFGSELKALKAHPVWQGELDRGAIALLLRYSYIPAPHSVFKNIRKLLPGTLLKISADGTAGQPEPYWTAREAVAEGIANPFTGSDTEGCERLEALLLDSVQDQMVADVPIGALLSGGIDSSTVVALMQTKASRPVRTFTIGFHESGFNEAAYAKEVARHLGTAHTELYLTANDALKVIPQLPSLYDEPFADFSQIPTFLISRLARETVTVSLSGDGGDELFGGYHRYLYARSIWDRAGWAPVALRRGVSQLMNVWAPGTPLGGKMEKIAAVLPAKDARDMQMRFVTEWPDPTKIVRGASEPISPLTSRESDLALPDLVQHMMYLDLISYLPDDILAKVDRASMAVSLEVRVPYLDHRVVEFAATVPMTMKIRGGKGKWLLRQVLYRHVPKELIERPKWGFTLPLDAWLRGPLRSWAENLLSVQRLADDGIFNPTPVAERWQEHLSGRRNRAQSLWSVLMFQAWLDGTR